MIYQIVLVLTPISFICFMYLVHKTENNLSRQTTLTANLDEARHQAHNLNLDVAFTRSLEY